MMRRLIALVMVALVACSNSSNDPQPSGKGIDPPVQVASPRDLLALQQRLEVPEDPSEAASALVAAALDPNTATAAVRELLTRTGVPIIGVDGVIVNKPATPVKVGVRVYDFQVPMLATSIQEKQSVRLERVAELAPALVGVELPEAVLSEAVASWLQSAPQEPGNPEALDAAFISELAKASESPAPTDRLALVSFLLLVGDLYGGKAVLQEPATPAAALMHAVGIGKADAAVPCPEEKYDPWDGIGFKSGKTLTDWLLNIFGEGSEASRVWGRAKKLDKAKDYSDLLNSTMARAALVAGLKVEVTNDSGGRKLHARHSSGGSDKNPVTFTATVRFETPWPGAMVQCGPMKGYTIPDNSTVSGIWVEWKLIGDYLETLDGQSSKGLKRGGGGGAATGEDGTTKLQAETVPENYCPNDRGFPVDASKCKKGNIVVASSGAKAELDLTRTPPIKIKDLLMGKSPLESTAKALFKVLMDVVTDIVTSSRAATSMVTIERHQTARYRFKGNESVGNFQITVEGESEAGLYGRWKVKWKAVSKTRNTENRIELVEDVVTSSEPGNLGEIRGKGTVVDLVHFGDVQSETKGEASAAGTATIGGGQDDPTITLTFSEFRLTMAGSGNVGGEAVTSNAEFSGAHGQASGQGTIKGSGRKKGSFNNQSAFAGQSRTYDLEVIK